MARSERSSEGNRFEMATLEVISENDGRKLYEFTGNEIVVGRNQFCDIILKSHTVSRQHARISHTDEGYFVEDLTSLNGTFLNRKRIDGRAPLKDKDRIDIYETALIFHADPPAVVAKAPTKIDPVEASTPKPREKSSPEHEITASVSARAPIAEPPGHESAKGRFRAAMKMTRDLTGSLDLDQMLPKILDSLFDIFPQADRGYVLLAEEPTGHLVPRAIKHRQNETGLSMTFGPISRKTAARVMSEGEAILMDDGAEQQTLDSGQSVFEMKILSVICAPLMGPSKVPLGIIYVDTTDPAQRFNHEDLNVLVTVATVAGQAVETVYERDADPGLARRRQELSTAKEVQLNLLPQRRPEVPGYQFHDYYLAAGEIGGDYYGYIAMPDGRLALAVGDVAGKGISAALLMAHFSSEVRYCLLSSLTPAEAVERLNQDLAVETPQSQFITFVLCVLDPVVHTLTVVNAGHMPPLCRRAKTGVVEEIGVDEGGMPLGCDPQRRYEQVETTLEPGDAIVLYTDGISEAMNADGEAYGSGAVRRFIARGPATVARLGDAIVEDVKRFASGQTQMDDICLLCFARVGW